VITVLSEVLPTNETKPVSDQAAVVEIVRAAHNAKTAVYPIGGGTSLDYGLIPRRDGVGLSLVGMNRVVDYPARDMTITVEPGITMRRLAETLAAERQWLPVDAPQPDEATLGGVIACAASGPRRFGWGTMRDYVIGISAVDGRGMAFKGGGRVVKNVAGYDFCKLLTGSLGTLGVITQVTLKIKPIPERSVLMTCDVSDLTLLEKLLAALVTSRVTPSVIEFVVGPAWNSSGKLIVGLEGTAAEVDWMCPMLREEWRTWGVSSPQVVDGANAEALWQQLREFPVDRQSPLVLKASVRPSSVCSFVAMVRKIDSQASIQSHAGTGIVIVRFTEFGAGDVSKALIGKLQPAACSAGGSCLVLSSEGLGELTRQAQWGGADDATEWMTKIKRQFDPHDVLNPGRFVYKNS
jgi:glycolate oxidase FAD binding subunit